MQAPSQTPPDPGPSAAQTAPATGAEQPPGELTERSTDKAVPQGGDRAGDRSGDLARFFALSLDLFCTATLDTGYFVTLNGAWSRTLGYSPEELRAQPFLQLVHPDDRASTAAAAGQLASGKEIVNFVNRYRHKDGHYRHLEWTSVVEPGQNLIYAVARDVTDREQAIERLREQELLLRQVASGAPIVISLYDREGVLTAHMGAGLKKLGLVENQLRGVSVFEAFKGADEALVNIRRALAGEEGRNTQDLGGTIWDNWFGPSFNERGEQIGAISVSTDVTERERSQQALAERLRIIEDQHRAIRSLIAPIIEVWQGVLVVPVVGQLDPGRTSALLERLLEAVAQRGARYAILDLTAVEVIDTATAQLLHRVVTALRLLGTEGLISGIRPSVAQALVGLGVDLAQVNTVASLHAALRRCMGDSVGSTRPR